MKSVYSNHQFLFTLRFLSILSLFFALSIGFQNCGSAEDESAFDSTSEAEDGSLLSEEEKALLEETPFAFDVGLDQISYMSCRAGGSQPKSHYDYMKSKSQFYTFRYGAYEKAGLQVTDEFLNYASSKLNKPRGSDFPSDVQMVKLINKSPKNHAAQIQSSFKSRISPADTILLNDQSRGATMGVDYADILKRLDTDYAPYHLLSNPGKRFRYLVGGNGKENRRLEASLYFNNDDQSEMTFVNAIGGNNENALMLYFRINPELFNSTANLDYFARSPEPPVGSISDLKIYGREYLFRFNKSDIQQTNNAVRPRVISDVQEYDLETNSYISDEGNWSCPNRLQLKIVREADRDTYCPYQDMSEIEGSASMKRRLEIVRRHLSAQDWDVNLNHDCAVPKNRGYCYPNDGVQVEYSSSKWCGDDPEEADDDSYTQTNCLHYISFCIKQ